ncbi:MAG TPA: YceI family protein, partial [Cyclobacteriaceae bacterium]|nr:YceI family protein [Cyclobacteriaceae bacterium]
MEKDFVPVLLMLLISLTTEAQVYTTSKGSIRLEGVAQQETIVAESKALEGKFDVATRKFNFRQSLNQFSFSQGELQKKDAQEKYWETEKYPYATFKGMVINDIDFKKNGDYEVTAKGILSMHGVDNEAKLSVK